MALAAHGCIASEHFSWQAARDECKSRIAQKPHTHSYCQHTWSFARPRVHTQGRDTWIAVCEPQHYVMQRIKLYCYENKGVPCATADTLTHSETSSILQAQTATPRPKCMAEPMPSYYCLGVLFLHVSVVAAQHSCFTQLFWHALAASCTTHWSPRQQTHTEELASLL